ncbi:MAG: hypothetical protein AAGA37_16605 [Actinomycetota bacterium]
MAERRQSHHYRRQLRPFIPLLVVWMFGLLALAAALGQGVIRHETLLLDPVATGRLPWYTGLISQLGAVVWCIAACAAAFGAAVSHLEGRMGAFRFLLGAAGVGTLMLVDDLFLLHSTVLPRFLGTSKTMVLATYALLILLWLARSLTEIARTRVHLLVATGAALGFSVIADQLGFALWMEDGPKMLGILAWATYLTTTSWDITRSVVVAARANARESVAAGR